LRCGDGCAEEKREQAASLAKKFHVRLQVARSSRGFCGPNLKTRSCWFAAKRGGGDRAAGRLHWDERGNSFPGRSA
jgi:hypothetical protein